MATPASLHLGRRRETGEVETNDQVSLVSGEEVTLECEARGAHPPPQFIWSVPGQEEDHAVVSGGAVSRLVYTARAGDHEKVVRCSSVQTHPTTGDLLYTTSTNISLSISQPAPLLSISDSSPIAVITGGLLAVILVIIIISLALFLVKKKKRINSSRERVSGNKVAAVESKSVEQIWVTDSSKHNHHHHQSSDSSLQCTAEIHNSSSSSSNSSSSSHDLITPEPTKPSTTQGDYISYSPAYMYSSYEDTQLNPGPYSKNVHHADSGYRSYKPRGLGQFDPSTDVYSVTRPNTGHSHVSHLSTFSNHQSFPDRPRPLKIYSDTINSTGHDTAEVQSNASVFDCHHGCFTPDPSEVSLEDTLNNRDDATNNRDETVKEPVTPVENQDRKSVKMMLGVSPVSNNSMVPVNIPIDISDDAVDDDHVNHDDYSEMYHTSMGHLYTVKTKDIDL